MNANDLTLNATLQTLNYSLNGVRYNTESYNFSFLLHFCVHITSQWKSN